MQKFRYTLLAGLSAVVLCSTALSACSSGSEASTEDQEEQDASSNDTEEQAGDPAEDDPAGDSDDGNSQKDESAADDESKDSEDNSASSGTSDEEQTNSSDSEDAVSAKNIKKELKMDSSAVKLPSSFPEQSSDSVDASITTNEKQNYTVEFQGKDDTSLAEMSASKYSSADNAVEKLDEFQSKYRVGKIEERSVDLGHGITGYAEGAAGNQYLSWEEGNWLLSIHSLSQDQMDQVNIAEQMVDYLEEHTLPPPDKKGAVVVNYDQGGNDVTVDIRWQEGSIVYQLKTEQVPLDALQMTTSMSN